MRKCKVCDMLGIEYPIIQGGMAWVADADLAAAVSNAGGLGLIGAGQMPGEFFLKEIKKAKQLTNKPFGVNVMLMSPFVDEVMDIIIAERIPVVTTGAGNPGKYVQRLKEIGSKIFPVVASVALAKRMERLGVDGIIAEGTESGGHVGESGTFALVPQVADAVSIPVIAAGGIADARGVVAAFALGAQGVQSGSVFVVAKECNAHANYKQAVIAAKDRSTVVTGRATGHPVRCIKNALTKEFERLESLNASMEEIEALGAGRLRAAVVNGDSDMGSIMIGQIAGMISEEATCREIIIRMFDGTAAVLERLNNM